MLLAKSTDGGNTFSAPVKVADFYELPDCDAYQGEGKDPGRSCVPEKGATANSFFRAANYPVGAVNPKNRNQVVVTFASYINQHSNEKNGCIPAGFSKDTGGNLYTGVKTAGACNNDIVVSRSRDAGATFTGTTTNVRRLPTTPDRRRADQWFQWADFDRGGHLAVMSYDRQYGDDELTGYSDVTVSGSPGFDGAFAARRATTSSMPPATQFGGLFWGDYAGLSVEAGAHPIWSDTRDLALFSCRKGADVTLPPTVCTGPAVNADRANDQNGYTRALRAP
jgi:hypothetical protein